MKQKYYCKRSISNGYSNYYAGKIYSGTRMNPLEYKQHLGGSYILMESYDKGMMSPSVYQYEIYMKFSLDRHSVYSFLDDYFISMKELRRKKLKKIYENR
jgi:hypothetical protein